MRIAFLLSKDPTTTHGGDLTLQRLLMDLAAEKHDVVCVCQSPDVDTIETTDSLVRVPKEPLDLPRLARRSLRRRHSVLHSRYDSDAFVAALDALEADRFVTDHGYMAEPFLRSRHGRTGAPLLITTTIQESMVWAQTRGRLGKLEARRIARDERRVARAAHALGTYDEAEADAYRAQGIARVTWLDVTLPPGRLAPVGDSAPQVVFLGHREWPPNAVAAERLRSWWPQISAGIAGAQLLIVGPPPAAGVGPDGPGVRDLGFVDDLAAVLDSSRALAAPIETGGGVRVKILDAATRGLPVVSTSAGIGSLAQTFGLTAYDDKAAFVQRCRDLLADPALAAGAGSALYAANEAYWASGRPRAVFHDWLEC